MTLRIGCGAGFSSDRLGPAIDLAAKGRLDFLTFETIGERTMAYGHRDRHLDPRKGFNPHLAARMRGVLPACRRNGTRIVTNMGVANVAAAVEETVAVARELGLSGLKIAAVEGDEVSHLIGPATLLYDHHDRTVKDMGLPVVGANAYLGIEAILPALEAGADVVITGRVADASLVVAPIVLRYGWRRDDWPRLGQATVVGHLMGCGMQVCGGYFADPGKKDVPRLAQCGYPIAEVDEDGSVVITKLADAGGLVSMRNIKEQLFYEVHNPAVYPSPDVTANFATASIAEVGRDRVSVSGGSGTERPANLKVTVGFDAGFLAEAGISYAGRNAVARARLAADILADRLGPDVIGSAPLRIDLIGVNSLYATAATPPSDTEDVRVRVAVRSRDRVACEAMLWETESLYCCGPAGGAGYRGQIMPNVITHSALVPREAIAPTFRMIVA